jgi:demethylmenaquinone methyltransferase/2-methoxy-6-polyprenyl-1,4-benzoquinol methylase
MSRSESTDTLLAEQIAYYRAIAMEYVVDVDAARALAAVLEAYQPSGRALELACGPGVWTELLLRYATTVTAIDSAPEMLARAKARVGVERVRFIQADLFHWTPDQRYDFVFFGFWLSHVPLERFESFWSMVAGSLAPAGRVFFVDDNARTPEELIEGDSSTTIRRYLTDGAGCRLVKVPYQPAALEERLARLGWRIRVKPLFGPFFWGAGSAAPDDRR